MNKCIKAIVFLFVSLLIFHGILNSDDPHKSLLKKLDNYITEATTTEKFSGSVLLAKDGKPFFKKAYGFASRRFWVPNKIDTKFNLIENHEKLGCIVGHSGGFFGISSTLDMYLDTGYTVVIMSNYGDGVEVVSGDIQKVIQSLVERH